MDRSQADPKLGEVRAVLQRLQTFSAQPDGAGLHSEKSETGSTDQSIARRRASVAIMLTIAALCAVLGAVWLTISPTGRANAPAATTAEAALTSPAIPPGNASVNPPALRPPSPSAAVEVAQGLLAKGQVQAARKQLLGVVSRDAADVAWMLARSYDPNVLAAIPAPDGGPDIEQATRWYRAWHAAAVTQGLVPNSVSVERIIGSMR